MTYGKFHVHMVLYRLSDQGSTVADLLSKGDIRRAKEMIGPKARMIVPSETIVYGLRRPSIDGLIWGQKILSGLEASDVKVVHPGFL